MERAGFYFQNWNELEDKWIVKAKAHRRAIEEISVRTASRHGRHRDRHRGRGPINLYDLQHSYHELIEHALELWQYHFEFLNLGYAAYLDYFGFCKQVFP